MTYGSPASLERDEIGAYLTRVRGGREPSAELVEEFTHRHRLIGGSPLIRATRAQASALEDSLGWPVDVGFRAPGAPGASKGQDEPGHSALSRCRASDAE
jgi:protoheme ferro-lyase